MLRGLMSRLSGRAGSDRVVFEVGGMTCGSCVARIEGILSGQPGVKSAAVDLASSRARVTFSGDTSPDRLVAAVTDAGYTMALLPSDS